MQGWVEGKAELGLRLQVFVDCMESSGTRIAL